MLDLAGLVPAIHALQASGLKAWITAEIVLLPTSASLS
jgi:hypothetical protein